MVKTEPKRAKCYKCGHEWWTQSTQKWITCPHCYKSLKREKALNPKEEEG